MRLVGHARKGSGIIATLKYERRARGRVTPLLEEDPRDARLRGRLFGFGYLFVTCGGGAFGIAYFAGDKVDWVLGTVFLPFGTALMWTSLRHLMDRQRLVLMIIGLALCGILLGAAASAVGVGAR